MRFITSGLLNFGFAYGRETAIIFTKLLGRFLANQTFVAPLVFIGFMAIHGRIDRVLFPFKDS